MSKSHEKIYILTGLSLLCLTSVIAFGAEPPVQIATLRWNGDGEFMSWRWEKLGEPFEDGAARFAAESRIVSPRWAALDVLGAEVALRCSTNAPSRFLQVSFLRDGKVVSGQFYVTDNKQPKIKIKILDNDERGSPRSSP